HQRQNGSTPGAEGPQVRTPEAWPDPILLPVGLPPVQGFDCALLPAMLRPWAEDIWERVQCPPDFVSATIMAALRSILGRKVGIGPQARTAGTVIPNQWALMIGRPGVLKPPAMEAALAPVKRLQACATEAHDKALVTYRQVRKLAKLQMEA